ncbi:hypothetical protein IQ235_00885 [Oscillatoriales cyanobacterium LEGE 11467]|uniref:Uncharacterized protein n=1 Tax=Zarconia navalis LEGE 11467 TaxID=1828826 RepID=A0A928VX05_9CYAN|nr:hypothetical protein [Zarconia navalis]MBE9039350.1 hypothetical protein [Zarconia navalis LEGE 11467]
MSAKINGKFYPLTGPIAAKLRQAKLTAAEWRIWSYLVELDPHGDRYLDLDTLTVMTECDCSKATFYRAIGKFQKLGIFDFQDKGWSFKNQSGVSKLKRQSQNCSASLKNETAVSKMKPPVSKMRLDSQNCENRSPEPPPDKASESSQTNKTYSDFIQTLSEGERERFLKFARSKADRLPETPQLIEKWIVDNHHWLYLEFEKINGQEPKHSGPGQNSAPPIDDEKNELHPDIEAGLADGRIDRLDPKFDGLFDAQNNWWKVDAWIENAATRGDDADAPNDCDKYRSQVREWLAQSLVNNLDDKTEPVSLTPIPQPQEVS